MGMIKIPKKSIATPTNSNGAGMDKTIAWYKSDILEMNE